MTSLVTTITETLRYRGAIGQWSWVLHRVTGLGVVLFLTLHVIDTSWAVFYPDLYVKAIAIYQTPLFTIGEFALTACVVYHALNGIRIGIFDAKPELWRYQAKAAQLVLIGTVLLLIPTFLIMFGHVLEHYSHSPTQLPLEFVLIEQLPFAVGIAVAVIVALFAAVITQPLFINRSKAASAGGKPRAQGSRIEKFWWGFMRLSGLLIVPLVFGHLAMIHLIQGVFALSVQGAPVVGTTEINMSGTSVEFVMDRWNYLVAGVAIWRIYDILLLGLVTLHGFNGLRYVLTDYTSFNPILKRAAIYLCTIAAVVLLAAGGGALLGSITDESVRIAEQAMAELYGEVGGADGGDTVDEGAAPVDGGESAPADATSEATAESGS